MLSLLRNLKIQHKILAGYGAIILLVFGLAVLTSRITDAVAELDDQVLEDAVPDTIAIGEVQETGFDLVNGLAELSSLVLSRKVSPGASTESPEDVRADLQAHRAALTDALERFQALPQPDDDPDEYSEAMLKSIRNLIEDSRRQEEFLLRPETLISEIRAEMAHASADATLFAESVNAALAEEQSELSEAAEALSSGLMTARWSIWFGVAGVVAACLLAALVIATSISRPITALHAASRRVGDGDLTVRIDNRSQDEIGELAGAFNDMVAGLRDAEEKLRRSERLSMLGQVAGTVSHELRNPLGAIQGSVDLVRTMTEEKGIDVGIHLDRMERSVERCNRIIGDLLEFTRVKSLKKQPVVFDQWLNELLDEHKLPAEVAMRREIDTGGLAIKADPMRLRQVMINLLDNAVQALTTKGWCPVEGQQRLLTVQTAVEDSWLRVCIIDNGPGIDRDDLDRIFEPLFTTKSFGVGLGLPTVRQLVEQHAGTVEVTTSTVSGTTFTVRLPLTDAKTIATSTPVAKVA